MKPEAQVQALRGARRLPDGAGDGSGLLGGQAKSGSCFPVQNRDHYGVSGPDDRPDEAHFLIPDDLPGHEVSHQDVHSGVASRQELAKLDRHVKLHGGPTVSCCHPALLD